MKILQINVVYKKGSTGKIVYDIHNVLKDKGIESIVCYGRGQKPNGPDEYKTSSELLAKLNNIKSRITGLEFNGSFFATIKLIRILKKEKPDIIHLHCINGFFVNIYWLIAYLKKSGIKTILTMHAEFMYTGGCGHAFECEKWKTGCGNCPQFKEMPSYLFDRTNRAWRKMKLAFDGFNENLIVTSVSPWLEERARQSVILGNKKHCTILNGIDTVNVFHPCDFSNIKRDLKLTDEKIICHITANFSNEIKGGKYIRELSERLKDKNIKIIVVGNTDKNLKLPDNIIDVGRINDQNELAAYYSMADLTVITSKRETFSMVCAESLSCGTPVVGFKAGAPEQISLREYSEFVEYGDLDALERTVHEWIELKSTVVNVIVEKAQGYYSKEKMCESYLTLYKELVNKSE
ncbi:glycosyltransferase [Neobacillus ginsengisoli]|uniref:Glycosyltransferase involved in cell wall biosynthesis n=1 Tax=Neobacillus ginsengisoli TaxID=904295 RepID=A0ABT9XZ31_9BACI|nr:glycosyltransferase [Neobacillus ginsengisoli]MDQ0200739.1 glycosyltransferase involved in cell wall biosynthesis [Neobacillus ginsengisoli]